MKIASIGTDIVEVQRIRNLYSKHGKHLLETILTKEEMRKMEKASDPLPFLASHWAGKEAVYKLFRKNLEAGIAWTDIELKTDSEGKMHVSLSGKAETHAKKLEIKEISLSVSQTKGHALAQAMAFAHNRN